MGAIHRLSASALLLAGLNAAAQAPDQPIRATANEVIVDLVVHDRHGKLLKKLDPKDLTLYEDGVAQDIRSVRLISGAELRTPSAAKIGSPPAPAPGDVSAISPLRTVNLVCLVFQDLSPETRKVAFDSALTFLNNELRPNTIIGVFTLDDRGVKPLSRFTNNRAALVKAIQQAAAGQTPALGTSQELFAAMGLERQLSMTAPPLPPQAGSAAQQPDPTGVDFQHLGAPVDASVAIGEAADTARNPLGRQSIHYERVVAIRELQAIRWLVDELRPLPFRKTVLLLSPGINRPASELESWNTLLKSANAAAVSFYAMEITGPTAVSPMTASKAALQRTAALSQQQGQPAGPVGGAGVLMDRAQQNDVSEYGVATANTHATLVDLVESTGGFLITDNSPKMLARVMDDVQTHFELTYHPALTTYDGRFHKIEVKLNRENQREDRIEARSGYFAVPESTESANLTPEVMAGLRVLNTTPVPHDFDYQAQALRFLTVDRQPEFAVSLDVPIPRLTATAEPAQQKHRVHASLLALVKDSHGQIVQQLNSDSPLDLSDAELGRSGHILFTRALSLPAGHYTVETSVVDWQSGRTSASVFPLDTAAQQTIALSSIALVGRVDLQTGPPHPDDPLEYQGKRIVPSLATDLPPGTKPSLFFRIYPDKSIDSKPRLNAKFILDGRTLADQNAELPPPDESGSIPVLIQGPDRPGNSELKLTVTQGAGSAAGSIRYTIQAPTPK